MDVSPSGGQIRLPRPRRSVSTDGKIRSTPSCRMSDNQEFLSLQMCAQSGLHWPSEADPSITEDDLFALLRYVENRCTKRQQLQVRRLMLSEAECFCNRFASRTSKSDLVMTARLAYGALLGVIGGAAKGELDAMGCALPSAIQISCDFLTTVTTAVLCSRHKRLRFSGI